VGDSTLKSQVSGVSWDVHNCTDGYAYTAPVGGFKPNAWGLHDMIGNAWQWTEDCWNANYGGAPSDGSGRAAGDCSSRVARGGSWINGPLGARSAHRTGYLPLNRSNINGLRLARMLP
jgi:formylglycine-generating enzyme required for sulfatase activity